MIAFVMTSFAAVYRRVAHRNWVVCSRVVSIGSTSKDYSPCRAQSMAARADGHDQVAQSRLLFRVRAHSHIDRDGQGHDVDRFHGVGHG